MNAQELIDKLKEFPPDMKVNYDADNGGYWEVNEVKIIEHFGETFILIK